MLRHGPIPQFLHGIIEYVAAIAFFAMPFLLDFRSDAATYLSVATGVLVLVVAATSAGPTSLVKEIPVAAHVIIDYVVALGLIAAPFAFDFTDDRRATAWFIGIGAAHLLITIGTRFLEYPTDHVVGSLAEGTSTDIEAGVPTVLDDK